MALAVHSFGMKVKAFAKAEGETGLSCIYSGGWMMMLKLGSCMMRMRMNDALIKLCFYL